MPKRKCGDKQLSSQNEAQRQPPKIVLSSPLLIAITVLIGVAAIWFALPVPAVVTSNILDSSSSTSNISSPASSSSQCSDASDLRKRIARSLNPKDGITLTEEGRSLRATLDNVLSPDECQFLVHSLPPSVFRDAGGYESTSNKYNAPRKGYSGIGLKELAGKGGDAPLLKSKHDYERFVVFRERIRAQTERALNLCQGTLKIDYTHVSQKTKGGKHHPHADNCFHYYRDIESSSESGIQESSLVATCDPTKVHPYASRVAASILYLNDEGYKGGEFYWASRSSEQGTPETIVAPREGRMTVFTSGIENLHGGLPVREVSNKDSKKSSGPSRRLALAMWYVASKDPEEKVPEYGQSSKEGDTEEDEDPNSILLFEVPVESIQVNSLLLKLGIFLVGRQNMPSRNSWKVNRANDNTLYMIYSDQQAMISIVLKPRAIVVRRHTDGINDPSPMYQSQESMLLQGILTEIETQAGNSLVRLKKADIEKTRSTLPIR